jgi:hypothetical protein
LLFFLIQLIDEIDCVEKANPFTLMDSSGNFSTLFSPGPWKVLHAV